MKIKEYHVEATEKHEKHGVTLHDGVTLKKQEKKLFNKLLAERTSEFFGTWERIDPTKLIFNFKTEAKTPENFTNYQIL